jgi:hypothetical protein
MWPCGSDDVVLHSLLGLETREERPVGTVAEESKVYFQIPSLKLMFSLIFIFGPFYLQASGITSSDGAACLHNVVLSPVT